jgi:hypothetical protein
MAVVVRLRVFFTSALVNFRLLTPSALRRSLLHLSARDLGGPRVVLNTGVVFCGEWNQAERAVSQSLYEKVGPIMDPAC